jgi:hypothetical protein
VWKSEGCVSLSCTHLKKALASLGRARRRRGATRGRARTHAAAAAVALSLTVACWCCCCLEERRRLVFWWWWGSPSDCLCSPPPLSKPRQDAPAAPLPRERAGQTPTALAPSSKKEKGGREVAGDSNPISFCVRACGSLVRCLLFAIAFSMRVCTLCVLMCSRANVAAKEGESVVAFLSGGGGANQRRARVGGGGGMCGGRRRSEGASQKNQ